MEHYFDKKYKLEIITYNEDNQEQRELVHLSDDLVAIYNTIEQLKIIGKWEFAVLNDRIYIDIKKETINQREIKYIKKRN